ncbi:MAG TPA: hypothetical protein DCK95_03850 [Anaerolineaceae bacterium]|nr:hypothetical protein [Anaerolineaceae bacterium]
MIVDAHAHVWVLDPQKYPWNPIGGYIPQEEASLSRFLALLDQQNIEHAVLVQPTPYGWDNSYLMECARGNEERLRRVVLVNPLSAHAGLDLQSLIQNGANGLRINLHLNPPATIDNENFMTLWDTIDTLKIPVCLQLTPLHFSMVRTLAEKYPSIKIILDHLARPEIGSSPMDSPFQDLLELCEYPNIYVKLSGLNYYSKQKAPYRDTWQLLSAVANRFTPQRCMWGSDFPFIEEHWSYAQNLETFKQELGFPTTELEWILGGTAGNIWWNDRSCVED